MTSRKLPILVVALIFFILLLNSAAMKFHWYYSLPWLDLPMHFLGGVWLTAAILLFKGSNLQGVKVLFWVLLAGILWEIFEFFNNNYIGTQDPFDLADTLSDLVFDVVGAGAAFLWLQTRNETHR